jgi:hypothetical protein
MSQLIKTYTATAAAINSRRIVKFDGTTKTLVLLAAAATDNSIGVATEVAAAASERVDVIHHGVTYVEAGAAFNPGAMLTADSVGRAVAASPAAGTNNRIVGIAIEEAAAAGDLVLMLVNPFSTQG